MAAKLKKVKADAFVLEEDARMPNNELPVVLYARAVVGSAREQLLHDLFKANDWHGAWSNGIFGYHHFHSNAHEVLGVAEGYATIILGGDSGKSLQIEPGDILVLPAGTGHRRIEASPDFLVVGAYPRGQERPDEYLDKALCANYRNRIRAVQIPSADPLFGSNGPLMEWWPTPS